MNGTTVHVGKKRSRNRDDNTGPILDCFISAVSFSITNYEQVCENDFFILSGTSNCEAIKILVALPNICTGICT